MRSVWILGALAFAASGCGGGEQCQFNSDCPAGSHCTDTGTCFTECSDAIPCPPGETCTSFGMCIAVEGDGGAQDAGARDGGVRDGGTPDAGPPAEACTPSTAGSSASDEDGDDAIDEGCAWHFGVPHPVVAVHPGPGLVHAAGLSNDGRRLWITAPGEGPIRRIFRADRASRDAPFGAPVDVTTALGITVPNMVDFWMSSDELEIILDGGTDLYRATRTSTSSPFGPATPIAELSLPGETVDYAPKLTSDGLEIFFTRISEGVRTMWHAGRASREAPFGTPSALILEGATNQDAIPMPSADGLTVFFARYESDIWTIQSARRESRSTLTFGAPVAIEALTAPPYSVVSIVSEATREVFLLSDRAWTPSGSFGIWRAEICRDGPCPARTVDCPAPGVRSPDGLHCYLAAEGGSQTRAAADTACAALGAHAPTLHSEAERALVWSRFSSLGAFWLAGSDAVTESQWSWSTGEPWTFGPWGNAQPDDCRCFGGELEGGEDCVELNDGNAASWGYAHTPVGTMNDLACGVTRPVVCETELWPTW